MKSILLLALTLAVSAAPTARAPTYGMPEFPAGWEDQPHVQEYKRRVDEALEKGMYARYEGGYESFPKKRSSAAFKNLVIFGDSLSDNGNVYAMTNKTCCVAGATGSPPFPVPSVVQQVQSYVQKNGGSVDPGNLYNVFIGGNDVLNTLGGVAQPGPATPQCMVDNVSKALWALIDAGAKNIALYQLPDLGRAPVALAGGDKAVAAASALSTGYNALLPAAVKNQLAAAQAAGKTGVNMDIVPIAAYFDEMLKNPPTLNGQQVTILNQPCVINGKQCEQAAQNDNQAPSYMFWDAVHPTKQTHITVAKKVEGWLQNKGWATLN